MLYLILASLFNVKRANKVAGLVQDEREGSDMLSRGTMIPATEVTI